MVQESNQFGLQIGILDIVGVGEEGNTKRNGFIANCREQNVWYKSMTTLAACKMNCNAR